MLTMTDIKPLMWKIESAEAQEGREQSERRNALIEEELRKTQEEKQCYLERLLSSRKTCNEQVVT